MRLTTRCEKVQNLAVGRPEIETGHGDSLMLLVDVLKTEVVQNFSNAGLKGDVEGINHLKRPERRQRKQ